MNFEYVLFSSVDLLTMFNLGVVNRMIMPNAVRQMIAHEVSVLLLNESMM